MATAKGDVDIAVKLRGAREFASDTRRVSSSIKGIEDQTERTSRQVGTLDARTSRLRGAMGRLGPVAAAAGGALAAFGLVEAKQAIDATLNLGMSTMRLNRMTQMGVEESSRLAAVAKVRGIEDKKLGMSITRLSNAMVGYRKGTESAREALDFFGVSQDAIRQGDFQSVLVQLADGYKNSTDAAKKNVYMQQLLGRTWQDLAPLFAQGGAGLAGELDQAAIFREMDIKNVAELRKGMRDTQYATLALQVTLGREIIPALAKAARWVTKFLMDWRRTGTTANDIRRVLQRVFAITLGAARAGVRVRNAMSQVLGVMLGISKVVRKAFPLGPVKAFGEAGKRAANLMKGAFSGVVDFIKGAFGRLRFTINLPDVLPGPDSLTVGFSAVPGLAEGGRIRSPGLALVGERGPELLRLPRGAQVEPLPAGAGFGGTVVTKVYLDRRQIAEAVGAEFAGRQARR